MFCVNCGREIDDDQLFCPYCGVKLQPDEEEDDDYIEEDDESTEAEDDYVEEDDDSEEDDDDDEYDDDDEEDGGNKKAIIIIIIAAVVVIAALIAAFMLLSGNKKEETAAQDTTPPKITVIQNSIDKGETFDINDFVSVEDDVDGPISENNFTVDGHVNTTVPGDYTLEITASDTAGNVATRELTIEVVDKQGDKAAFIKKIAGLWLNGCQSAADAKDTAQNVGMTDVSMTEFVQNGDQCIMSTLGDITGEYDGDTVPDITSGLIEFTYISTDLCTAKGTVNGMEISFDLGDPNDQVIMYSCGGYYTHCAYTGFSTERAMDDYLTEKWD